MTLFCDSTGIVARELWMANVADKVESRSIGLAQRLLNSTYDRKRPGEVR